MARTRILVVDDEPGMLELCAATLRVLPETEVVLEDQSPRAARRFKQECFDLLISDIRMPEMSGIELLRQARQEDPQLSVLVLTAYPTVETAVECMKLGAMDYLSKPFLPEDLLTNVRSLLEGRRLREENHLLRRQVERSYCCGELVGQSPVMLKVCERIQRTAETDLDVLVIGETGTVPTRV